MDYKCPLENCDKGYDNVTSLSKHWCRTHKLSKKELYMILQDIAEEPTCACGCGGEVTFLDAGRGFREFVRGHASRVPDKNNFVSKKAQENSLKTRRKMFAEGELEIWNKGLTKETHESVAKYGKNGSKTIRSNPQELEARSIRMKLGRLDGTVPTLYGPEHSQWNGGTSTLRDLIKGSTKLYYAWKFPKMGLANFTCEKCNTSGVPLHVHHDKETMSEILKIVADNNSLGKMLSKSINSIPKKVLAMKSKLIDEVTDYHVQNNVSGIVLCKECHGKEHGNLNFK